MHSQTTLIGSELPPGHTFSSDFCSVAFDVFISRNFGTDSRPIKMDSEFVAFNLEHNVNKTKPKQNQTFFFLNKNEVKGW